MPNTAFKIQKILIPIDFSETSMLAIEHAGFTAQLFKAELVLLHVIERHWEQYNIISPEIHIEEPSGIVDAIDKRLDDIAEEIKSKYGVKSMCVVSNGVVLEEVLAISKEQNIDLVIMGTHGVKGFVEFFLGSNTYKVITYSDCPVLSVQSHATKLGFENIILPIDNTAHSRQKVHQATVLANHFGSVIHIVGLRDTDNEALNKSLESKVEQVAAFFKKEGIANTKKYVSGNNQATLTLDYAKEVNADLIIIMDDQEENLMGRLLGAYAQQIVNHSKIPTLCIPPHFGHLSSDSITSPFYEG